MDLGLLGSPSPGAAAPRRLLLVDAGPVNAEHLRPVLEHDPGVPVDAVPDGRAALGALTARPYGLVLSDLLSPPSGGLQLLQAVRRQRLDVPVVLLAGPDHVTAAAR